MNDDKKFFTTSSSGTVSECPTTHADVTRIVHTVWEKRKAAHEERIKKEARVAGGNEFLLLIHEAAKAARKEYTTLDFGCTDMRVPSRVYDGVEVHGDTLLVKDNDGATLFKAAAISNGCFRASGDGESVFRSSEVILSMILDALTTPEMPVDRRMAVEEFILRHIEQHAVFGDDV